MFGEAACLQARHEVRVHLSQWTATDPDKVRDTISHVHIEQIPTIIAILYISWLWYD